MTDPQTPATAKHVCPVCRYEGLGGHRCEDAWVTPDGTRIPYPQAPATEAAFAWLIERGQPERQVPTVWLKSADPVAWTSDANTALRFERRASAVEVIGALFTPPPSRGGPSARAVEHGFIKPKRVEWYDIAYDEGDESP